MVLRQTLRALAASRWIVRLWNPLSRGHLCILTLHRFGNNTGLATPGTDIAVLDEILNRLERDGYRFWALQEAVERLAASAPLPARSVVFTVDDGYADFALAVDTFQRYRCPVTVFLATQFVDGESWLWWDEVEYCCLHAPTGRYSLQGLEQPVELTSADPASRLRLIEQLWRHCKRISDETKLRFVNELATSLGIVVPPRPPPAYAPLKWDDVRRLEAAGIAFAPHTVSHPILSRVGDAQARFEIEECWRRLRQETAHPIDILAYPNGQPGDFGEREFRLAAAAGLRGGVTAIPGYASARLLQSATGRFELPRFGDPGDADGACLAASGFVRLRHALS